MSLNSYGIVFSADLGISSKYNGETPLGWVGNGFIWIAIKYEWIDPKPYLKWDLNGVLRLWQAKGKNVNIHLLGTV